MIEMKVMDLKKIGHWRGHKVSARRELEENRIHRIGPLAQDFKST